MEPAEGPTARAPGTWRQASSGPGNEAPGPIAFEEESVMNARGANQREMHYSQQALEIMIETALSMSNVTTLITAAHQGAPGAEAELFNRLYTDLKRLAHAQLSNGRRPGDTLDTTVLVHEAYLRLSGGEHLDTQS